MQVTNGDRLLILFVFLLFVLSFWYLPVSFSQGQSLQVKIYQQNQLVKSYSLNEDKKLTVNGCVIQIKKNQVKVVKSNCPKKLCVKQGPINLANQEIICLPHKVVVTLASNDQPDSGLDAVVK